MENKDLENIVKYKDELTSNALQGMIDSLQKQVNELNTEISNKQRTLDDLNKPELSQEQFDLLYDAITDGIDNTNFEDDNFDYDPEFSGRELYLSGLYYNSKDILTENIQESIKSIFKITQKSSKEELDKENEQAVLNAEDPNYPTADDRDYEKYYKQ
tara:strand:- start:1096 stop:1569 length:474 start_codon:yes stop_codon:yes gene_type:complete